MRKSLATRIAALACIYCLAFFVIVILQFSNKGSFSMSVGVMTIRGRYADAPPIDELPGASQITGGVRIYFGGLEFSLNEVRGKGLTVTNSSGSAAVNPSIFWAEDNSAHFILSDLSSESNPLVPLLTFTSISTERGQELLISAAFSDLHDISEIVIPITPRRSSIVRNENRLGIMYAGSRYLFGSDGHELEEGKITLTREHSFISYRSRARQSAFDPSNFVIAQASNYESALLNWREESYLKWSANAAALQNEFDIIGYCTEALSRRNFPAATGAISREFISSTMHSFKSASFVGGMANAHRTFTQAETAKMNTINSFVRERSANILKEEHILDYLFIRSNTALAYDIVDIINNLQPEQLTIDLCPGLLEAAIDLRRWRPRFFETAANNPIETLTEQILTVISENLVRDTGKDLVFASGSEGTTTEFSLRLGKALMEWAQTSQDTEWLEIGKSLVLSALLSDGPGAGKLYNIINQGPNDSFQAANYPKAVWLMDNGLWTWTASSSVRASNIDGDTSISFSFPVNMSHYIIIRGVRPFNRIQIHDTDWRTDSQFERYDSSGWIYYPQDQILILKLKHRETVENIRIIYRAPPPPAPEPEFTEEEPEY